MHRSDKSTDPFSHMISNGPYQQWWDCCLQLLIFCMRFQEVLGYQLVIELCIALCHFNPFWLLYTVPYCTLLFFEIHIAAIYYTVARCSKHAVSFPTARDTSLCIICSKTNLDCIGTANEMQRNKRYALCLSKFAGRSFPFFIGWSCSQLNKIPEQTTGWRSCLQSAHTCSRFRTHLAPQIVFWEPDLGPILGPALFKTFLTADCAQSHGGKINSMLATSTPIFK